MTRQRTILIAGAIAVLLVIAVAVRIATSNASTDMRRQAPVNVQVEQPKNDTLSTRLIFNADVLPIQQANIYSKVAGNLERMYVDIGARVAEGQLLALIDTMELSQLSEQAQATYENAILNFKRVSELAKQNLIAPQDRDNAEAALKVAKANYDAASTRLQYAHITAPFSGYITKRFLDPGVNIKSNDLPIFTLMNMDVMKILVNVLEKDIPLIAKGKKGIVRVDAYPGKEFYGQVTKLSQAVDLSTRTMAVQIDVDNRDHLLKPGMFAGVTVLVEEHPNTLTLPLQAILSDEKGKYVFVVNGSTAVRKGITTGIQQDLTVEILGGVTIDDRVVTTGAQFVKDGAQVNVQQ
jgi:RND family efflux transporter MFP subunit